MSFTIPASVAKKILTGAYYAKKGYDVYQASQPYLKIAKKGAKKAVKAVKAVKVQTAKPKTKTRTVGTTTNKVGRPRKTPAPPFMPRDRRRRVTRAGEVYRHQVPNTPMKYDKEYNKKGSVKYNEFGGEIEGNGTSTVYLNHTIAQKEFINSVYRAIIKWAYRWRGDDIRNWNEAPSSSGLQTSMSIYYYNQGSQNTNNRQFIVFNLPTVSRTYAQIAQDLEVFVRNNTVVPLLEDRLEFDSIYLFNRLRNGANTGEVEVPVCILDLKNTTFDVKIKSELRVINRTLAEPNAGDTHQDRDDITNIDIVPLKGKVYSNCGSWRNYIELNTRALQSTGIPIDFNFNKKLVGDPDTGIVQWVSSPTSSSNNGELLSVPPRAYLLGYKSESKVFIKPGDMSKNTFIFTTKMSFNKIVNEFASFFTVQNLNENVKGMRRSFGFIQGYALEKYLDANRASGSNIQLGYQLKQTYACALNVPKKYASNPILNITQTPISYGTDKPS